MKPSILSCGRPKALSASLSSSANPLNTALAEVPRLLGNGASAEPDGQVGAAYARNPREKGFEQARSAVYCSPQPTVTWTEMFALCLPGIRFPISQADLAVTGQCRAYLRCSNRPMRKPLSVVLVSRLWKSFRKLVLLHPWSRRLCRSEGLHLRRRSESHVSWRTEKIMSR